MSQEIPTLAKKLKEHGMSLTKQRQYIFNALADSDTLTMAQLIRKVKAKMDRASVYRTVDVFEKIGIINRVQIGWKYKLELSDLFADHHHHATCIQCGKVVSFEEDFELENNINHLASNLNFVLISHSLELRGLCFDCQKKS